MSKHKVFVSFHHDDQEYKDALVRWAEANDVFIDDSVEMGEIPEDWDDQRIREYIRDEHLRDTTVTILLVGQRTKYRKHVDWELYSSMHDGRINKKSGIIVIMLPNADYGHYTCSHNNEKVYYPNSTWVSVDSRNEYNRRYPLMPDRIIDNLLSSQASISVVGWNKIYGNADFLRLLIDNAYLGRANCQYDLSRPMRRKNG